MLTQALLSKSNLTDKLTEYSDGTIFLSYVLICYAKFGSYRAFIIVEGF